MSTVLGVSEQDWQLWREFVTMHRHLARELDRQLQRDAGISQADFSVLVVLSESNGQRLRTGELAELLAWEKSRVSHQVTRMEARDLVERSECAEDGRGTWVGITEEGRRVLAGANSDHADTIRTLFFDQLNDDEKAALGEASRRILDKMAPEACEIMADTRMPGAATRATSVPAA
ncbi:MAG: MarR family transcriptional regulator [Schumannella sp.]|nr:MarR family transcriptional regulator [Schumannella sp.]